MRLGRVRHVFEGLAEAAQLRDELLGLLRVDALVELAVGDEQAGRRGGRGDAPASRGGRRRGSRTGDRACSRRSSRRRRGRPATTSSGGRSRRTCRRRSETARPRPRRRRREPCTSRSSRRRSPACPPSTQSSVRRKSAAARQSSRSPPTPVAGVQLLERLAAARRATEVGREPRIPLVDEVLGVSVPVVAVELDRPAVRVDDRGHAPGAALGR